MLIHLREALAERDEGFTLIELLVVVIIIGILAAIAIPSFLAVRGNAGDATAQSDLRNGVIHMESGYTSNGTYPADQAALEAEGWEASDDSTSISVIGTATDYCVSLQSAESGNLWAVHDGVNEPYQAAAACSATNMAPAAA